MRRLGLAIAFYITCGLAFAQTESIEFASSRYKTSSGAIGPLGVVATHSFDLHVKAENTLILEGIIISGYYINGRDILLPPVLDGLLKLKLVITIHQKSTVWYNAQLTLNDITVPLDVVRKEQHQDSDPAVILKVKSKGTQRWIVKDEFDSHSSSFNK
tara:strand:- start:69 stop:542 length:474 start_codon:yes stop_codon:yes gene_type:complete